MNHTAPHWSRRRPGFTLIELLTVIAIIGILAAIIIPTVGKVRESAKRARCMSNVRQISLSLIHFANQDRQQRFPSYPGGVWAWDLSKAMVNLLVGQAGREVIYCPSGLANDGDAMWKYNPNFAVSNYILLVPGVGQIPQPKLADPTQTLNAPVVASEELSLVNVKMRANYKYKTTGVDEEIPASRRPLVVDTILRTGRDNYTDIIGGLAGNRTNHLSGAVPLGGNIGFVDGHVAWRDFSKMEVHSTGVPTFLW